MVPMENPLVSILIPVFNREEFIADCIRSALAQTYPNVEIVIADNASTDRTLEICQNFAQDDDRVRVFDNASNLGPVRNWKVCADHANGDFCKILFSDDLLEPTCIEKMLRPLMDSNVGLSVCAARIGETPERSSPGYFANISGQNRILRLKTEDYLPFLLFGDAPLSPGAVMLRRRDLLANIRSDFATATPRTFANHGAGPDLMVSLLTMEDYANVTVFQEPLVFFRVHPGSFTTENRDNAIRESYDTIWNYYLKNYISVRLWRGRVFNAWLNKGVKTGEGPRPWFRNREGRGTLTEVLAGLGSTPAFLRYKKRHRKRKF